MKIVGYRKLLDKKSPDNKDLFQYILFNQNITISCNFATEANIENADEMERKEILDMVFSKFYHHTKEVPIDTIFKLTPGNSTDTDYILPEFEGKFKKWCVDSKIESITKYFEE